MNSLIRIPPSPTTLAGDFAVSDSCAAFGCRLSGGSATRWADGVYADGADVLAWYDDPHFGRWAAATTRRHGAGRITYVGTVPDPAFARALLRWAAPAADDAWRWSDDSVTSTSGVSRGGHRLRFVHNWSWRTVTLSLPSAVQDVLSGESLEAHEDLELGPWDVRVLLEGTAAPAATDRPGGGSLR